MCKYYLLPTFLPNLNQGNCRHLIAYPFKRVHGVLPGCVPGHMETRAQIIWKTPYVGTLIYE